MNTHETLVILTPGFPADEDDSTCIPPQQLFVKALKKQKPELNIIVISFQYPFEVRQYTWHDMQVIALGGRSRGKLYRRALWLKVWRTLKQLNRQHQIIGLLSFWMGECAFIGNRFANKYGRMHYCWVLGQDARTGNRFVRLINPKGEQLIALSDQLAREVEVNYGIVPKHIIPPGIDTSMFGTPATKRDIDLMGAGSLIPLKQYELFVDVVKKLTIQFPHIKAVICGRGPEMERLKHQIIRLKLENNVKLTGGLTHGEVLAMMQRTKVFLHTSAYEGFGMVLSEALYAGAQVVSLVKPMDLMPEEFHQGKNENELVGLVSGFLDDKDLKHEPVLFNPIECIADKVTELFINDDLTTEGTEILHRGH
ncbi:Glycosyltransferase involved in cell wall bisynthesis [Mucilaginibacter mallensis]|uniref:Glycosyltransferase involved in cell wall bisynthesis n=1 Tax=Mucilaginibacter mallensis TaxID=652787 RepID=A0A1H1PHC1_MUCMA|nr:glycosyltransferase [Mucilaginibacter mallensis]SDS10477.1 Glycosyltransferase involved in cell wall bisynthesis [Mucilaginibacter mallensis]